MSLTYLLNTSGGYFIFFSILSVILYFFDDFIYFQYINTALFASGLLTLLLLARKYMSQSYKNRLYHDFFLLDSLLILSGMGLFSAYFILTI